MKTLILGVTFKEPVPINQPRKFLATGIEWKDWSIYADSQTREVVIDPPPSLGIKGRVRVPFENVVCMITGSILSDKKAAGNYSIADVPPGSD